MTFHDRCARAGRARSDVNANGISRFARVASALTAVAMLGGLAAGCASAARSTALVSEVTDATLVKEDSPLYRNVTVTEVKGGEQTTLISKSKLSDTAFENALETSLDVIGALDRSLLTDQGPIGIQVEILKVDQPNLQISFTTTARIKYTVLAAKTGNRLFQRTISSKSRVRFKDSIVREERIRLATEGAARENLKLFLRAFVAHSRANPTRYRKAVAADA